MNVKNLFVLLAALLISATACTNKKKSEQTAAETSGLNTTQVVVDWSGTYKGTLPCASCEGIETTITLNTDSTYKKTQVYLGEEDATFHTEGSFEWREDGSIIVLHTETDGDQSVKVTEGSLVMLDAYGNEITGELAEHYILKKTN